MLINITNPQAIEDWLQEISAGDDGIARWLQKAFTRALKKREESAMPLQEWPENPPAWMKPGGNYHEFRPDPELTEKVSHIRDWLVAARRQDPAFVGNLYPMDLASAFNRAEKYFTKQNQRNQNVIEDDADTKTIMRFDNGARIVRLMTQEALKYEGAQMGHCVGSGVYDESLVSGREVFYSLRDAQNKPHATMEVVVEGNILRQCKGKENKPPVEKYMPMLRQFLTQQEFRLKESAVYCGLVQDTDGQYYSLNNIPESFSVEGHLDLHGCTTLTQLPKNLSVSGVLQLANCTALTHLSENLSVGGDLSLIQCSALTQLPESLFAGGNINLICCTALTQLPQNFSVTNDLDLSGCKSLTQLPENLSVGGDLNLTFCTALTQLPENLSVGGALSLDTCKSLTHLPENLSVGDDLDLIHCKNITSIPRSLKCSGTIYTDIGNFATVTEAADAFDRKYRPAMRCPIRTFR